MTDIKNFFLLEGLSDEEKNQALLKFNDISKFSKGSLIYSTVKFSKAIGYITSGSAYAISNNDNSVIMKRFSSGMCFGVAAIFGSNKKYVSSVIAETDVEIIFITEDNLIQMFTQFPKTSINYITFLSEKIRFLNSKLSVLSCSSAENTVYKYLVSVTDSSGYAQLPKSMTLLSKMLGLARATLYRSLDSLENNGIIIREKNKIKVIKNEKID